MSKALEKEGDTTGQWESRPVQDSGEVTIPKKMREHLDMPPGSEVVVEDVGDGVKIMTAQAWKPE